MSEGQVKTPGEGMTAERRSNGFLSALSVILEWRRFIIINVVIVTVIAVVVSLLLPKWYRASASILPPKERDTFGGLGSASTILRGLTGRATGQASSTYNYFAILKSRTASVAVIQHFGLMDVYGIKDSLMDDCIKELSKNTAFEVQEDDNITLEVMDKDPVRAANMANFYVGLLNTMSIELGTREARNNREFLEKRVVTARREMSEAEDSLKKYQETSGMIIIPDQGNSGVSAVAELYGLKAKKEIELAIVRRNTSEDNPKVRQLEVELSEINRKVSRFPEIGVGSIRLYRNVAIQQKILEFVLPLYEQAKVDEQKEVPVLLVLDKAVVPEKRVKPQRSLIVFLAGSLSLMFCVVMAFLFHGCARLAGRNGVIEGWLVSVARWVAVRYRVHVQ
jgi:tyrosine-protein kinase Etk/Wzc